MIGLLLLALGTSPTVDSATAPPVLSSTFEDPPETPRAPDPGWLRDFLSAWLCHLGDRRADALRELRAEQRYAQQLGGVVDKAKLYRLQEIVRDADEEAAKTRARLKAELHRSALSCSVPKIDAISKCLTARRAGSTPPECETVEMTAYWDALE